MQLLNKFKTKLEKVKSAQENSDEEGEQEAKGSNADNEDEELNTDSWLSHTLHFEEQGEILAKDASTKKDDWHDIYDPRSSINKRKRGEDRRHNKDHHRSHRDRK